MIRPASASPAPPSPVFLIWERAMWPVTSETMIRVMPPTPMKWPNGAAMADARLTQASVFVWPGAAAIMAGVPIGTALLGCTCWPTICVEDGAGGAAGAGGGGGRLLDGVLTAGSSL